MLFQSIVSFLPLLTLTAAHQEMSWPYPLRSPFDPKNNWTNIDYSMTNPLYADGKPSSPSQQLLYTSTNSPGSNFPCKGYQLNTPWRTAAEYTAGGTYNMTLYGSATHGGGSCQLSLSYDNGGSFHVIESMEGGCPLTSRYDFVIPSDAANGRALFAWSWFNLIGNREMYMNCADVVISGGSGSVASFESAYPDLFVANVNNGCSTVGRRQTIFEHPGDAVIYGSGVGPSWPPFPKDQSLCHG